MSFMLIVLFSGATEWAYGLYTFRMWFTIIPPSSAHLCWSVCALITFLRSNISLLNSLRSLPLFYTPIAVIIVFGTIIFAFSSIAQVNSSCWLSVFSLTSSYLPHYLSSLTCSVSCFHFHLWWSECTPGALTADLGGRHTRGLDDTHPLSHLALCTKWLSVLKHYSRPTKNVTPP